MSKLKCTSFETSVKKAINTANDEIFNQPDIHIVSWKVVCNPQSKFRQALFMIVAEVEVAGTYEAEPWIEVREKEVIPSAVVDCVN